jgi:APA family basic amino acid/polyamine antiporter
VNHRARPSKELTLFDSVCLVVGIIVGVGIYQTAPDVARGAGNWWGVLLIWIVGGLLSLCGALGYAELASAYPGQGGDYVYLSRAYGRWAGFLFGWMQLAVTRPGDIAVMAFAFATYARAVFDPFADTGFPHGQRIYAAAAVIALTAVNVLGVREGKWTQNILTSVKALALLGVVAVAFFAPERSAPVELAEALPASVALILVLFTYGGWNEMAYVAAEVRNPKRNIVRALVLSTVAVTVLYLLVNGAFLHALGYRGVAASERVAADAVASAFPAAGANLISALVCISALGACNGLIFTGARISYAVGADHRAFAYFGEWTAGTGTPVRALLVQGLLALLLIVVLGSFVETILYSTPAIYTFYLATSLAVVVLRRKEPHVQRPYRVNWYPLPNLVFAAVCGFLIYSAVRFAIDVLQRPWIVWMPFAISLLGLPLYFWGRGGVAGREDSPPP